LLIQNANGNNWYWTSDIKHGKTVQSASAENQELKIFTLKFWSHHHFVLKFLQKQQYVNKILKIYQHYHQCFISAK